MNIIEREITPIWMPPAQRPHHDRPRRIIMPDRKVIEPRITPWAPWEAAGTVTVTSTGTGVSGASLTSMSPAPGTSNCLGKMVMLVVGMGSATPTIDSITNATYYLAKRNAGSWRLSVWIKNGESVEPTPTVNIGSTTGNMGSFVTVFSISGASFPTIAADGQGVLAAFDSFISSGITTAYYESPQSGGGGSVVGGGWAVQFFSKPTTGAGWTFTSIDISATFTNAGNAVKTSGAGNIVVGAQMFNSETTIGGEPYLKTPAINTNTSSTAVQSITIEFSKVSPGTKGFSQLGGGMREMSGGMRG